MQLRPRQEVFVDRCKAALTEHKNTVGIAPTGAGKTVCLSAITGQMHKTGATQLIIQHRDELVTQNKTTFELINPKIKTAQIDANHKRWREEGTNFAMIQTLARNLEAMPPLSILAVDECHHVAAASYIKVIDHARNLNPDIQIVGVTATPNRGDKRALKGTFDNVADQITIKELIDSGFLVPPRTFVVDVGVQDDLRRVRQTASDFNMSEVEAIMNKDVINERVVEEWAKVAKYRPTVVFCSTVAHATSVRDSFAVAGVSVGMVWGEMSKQDRRDTLQDYDDGKIQVLCNVAVLTEGWDHQPTACVILLRPSSFKSTMIQMIGRGLRKVDPERYPGVHKDDCVVMDFGTSILTHGDIDQDINLTGEGVKCCPDCESIVPKQMKECPICGFLWPTIDGEKKLCGECGEENPINARECWNCGELFSVVDDGGAVIHNFQMTEVDLLDASPYKWEPLFDGLVLVATAFDAWAMVISYNGRWFSLGGAKGTGVKILGDNEDRRLSLVSADDFLRSTGDKEAANKSKTWLALPATTKQLAYLNMNTYAASIGMTRYGAACRLTWKFQERAVRKKLEIMEAA